MFVLYVTLNPSVRPSVYSFVCIFCECLTLGQGHRHHLLTLDVLFNSDADVAECVTRTFASAPSAVAPPAARIFAIYVCEADKNQS